MLDRVTQAVLPWALAGVLGASLALLVILVVVQLARRLRAGRRDPLVERGHALVIELLAVDSDEEAAGIRAELEALRGRNWEIVVDEAFRVMPKFEGAAVERLSSLLVERGVMESQLARLGRGSALGRARAAQNLGNARWAAAAQPIAGLLAHGDPDVRAVAVRALGQISDPSTAGAVIRAVARGGVHIGPAIEALEPMGDRISGEILSVLRDPLPEVRSVAVAVVGESRIRAALGTLHDLVVNDEDRDVRRLTALALGRIGDDTSVRYLVASTTADPALSVALAAIEALGQITTDEAMEVLCLFAMSDDPAVGMAAANVIADIPLVGLTTLRGLRVKAPRNVSIAAAYQRCVLASGADDPESDPQWRVA